MPVNWDAFAQLPGAADANFETLCRALIRLHYARFGRFAALAQQPGIEFHLRLQEPCSLGEPGRWYGWQCRWYEIPSGRAIGATRRKKIADAIATTLRELPGITDWVLWTRYPLTKADQQWFYAIETPMRLHLWIAAEAEMLLGGPAEMLRSSYFGELVLSPDELADLRERAVAPIRTRWLPEVHQQSHTELELRRALGEAGAWGGLRTCADQAERDVAAFGADLDELSESLGGMTAQLTHLANAMATMLRDTHAALEHGDLDLLQQQLNNRPPKPDELVALPRELRARRNRAGLTATNVLASVSDGNASLDTVGSLLAGRLIAVVAEAGYGKTELAAQLTDAVGTRPAGLLLHGRDLAASSTLDALAQSVVIRGRQVPSMEALVAAVNATGERSRRRLPIAIDGLNEAEDPRDWKRALASLDQMLTRYPYVLVVVTVRGEFVDEALPADVLRYELTGFDHDVMDAIRRYFRYYRIEATDVELPLELLRHPLTLRLFCEVTNPQRDRVVGIERMPGSLTALFDRYLELAAERVAELAPRNRRYYPQDVRVALDEIGSALWEEKARSLDARALRRRLDDDGRPWNESLVRALEQEGILLRVRGDASPDAHVAVAYDALAGHIVAAALVTKFGGFGLGERLRIPETSALLAGPFPDRHPLASDIRRALAGIVPNRTHQQLWRLLDGPLRTAALCDAVDLEGNLLDAETVEALRGIIAGPSPLPRSVFRRLWQTRGAVRHPLNADFLDATLRSMSVADRDLRWTEWVRMNTKAIVDDLRWLERRWQSTPARTAADTFRTRWVIWMLTSTVRPLRDQATRTLYWFGRGDPRVLFELCASTLTINDPYVPERMLAASYGVTMARQYDIEDRTFVDDVLPRWGRELYAAMFAPGAPHATTHLLARNYARRMIEIAARLHPTLLAPEELERIHPPYREGGIREWKWSEDKDEEGYRNGNNPIDFLDDNPMEQLGPGISKYDMEKPAYKEIEGQLRWRFYELGYSLDAFGEIDSQIANQRYMRNLREEIGQTIGYGRKYCRIATCELAGYRDDVGLLRDEWHPLEENWTHVDIDPSFPQELPKCQMVHGDLLGNRESPAADWVAHEPDFTFAQIEQVEEIDGEPGPWVLLKAHISQHDERNGRRMFCTCIAALVDKAVAGELATLTMPPEEVSVDRMDVPATYYTYAGEIPWCETYPANEPSEVSIITEYETVAKPASISRDAWWYRGVEGNESGEETPIADEAQVAEFIKVPIRRPYNMTTATTHHGWESYHSELNPNTGADVPARQFADHLALGSRPQTFDLFDSEGRRASMTCEYGEHYADSQDFTYLRKDLLDRFLTQTGQRLLWVTSGERSFAPSGRNGGRDPSETPCYARYGRVRVYS